MQKWLNVFFILGSSFLLNACVEIKDVQEDPEVVQSSIPSAVIDEEIFLFGGDLLTKEEFTAMLATDLQQEDGKSFSYEFENLEITSRGVLYTYGQNIRLSIKNLIAENGSIQTFPENAKAARDSDGRSGGLLHLSIEKAFGFLNITMRGENGGDGLLGRQPDASMKGPDKISSCSMSGGGDLIISPRPLVPIEQTKGKSGYPGGVGRTGGNSGVLEVILSGESSQFSLRPLREVGKKGLGGLGGKGGQGGKHGSSCLPGLQKNGPTGASGEAGRDGVDGLLEAVCISRNGQRACY